MLDGFYRSSSCLTLAAATAINAATEIPTMNDGCVPTFAITQPSSLASMSINQFFNREPAEDLTSPINNLSGRSNFSC